MQTQNEDVNLSQAIEQLRSARLSSCQLAKRMREDADEIAALRRAVIDAAMAENRSSKSPEVLIRIQRTAESISPANASAFETALLECTYIADILIPLLDGAKNSRSDLVFSKRVSIRFRLQEFVEEFTRTFWLATDTIERNAEVVDTLRFALAALQKPER